MQVFRQIQVRNPDLSGAKAVLQSLSAPGRPEDGGWQPGLNTVWVPVKNTTARELVLSLEFADKWILLSEVTFLTSPAPEGPRYCNLRPSAEKKFYYCLLLNS